MTVVVSSDGRRLTLGGLLAKGGEGAVHHIVEAPDLVAKIYLRGKAGDRREKVEAMVSARLHLTTSFVAFPVDTLKTQRGEFLGFTMKKVNGFKSVHDLYGPASRKSEFPTADANFLVRAAINLARAIASVHATGCVIGDINHSGVLVSEKALVTLIDSDSFQFRSQSKLYRCLVGVPEYTPPELQGALLDRTDRMPNHDNFGLAVLLFQLLFLGRHPFAGRYRGKGDMDIRKAIGEGRFAYSERRAETMMEPPPYVPALDDYGKEVARAFETAFRLPAKHTNGRPLASEWVTLLTSVEAGLKTCAADRAHSYAGSLSSCPWCSIERSMGRSLFAAQYSPTAPIMDIGQLLTAIRGIPAPGKPPEPEKIVEPLLSLAVSPAGQQARSERRVTVVVGIIAIIIGLYLMTSVQGFWGSALVAGAGFMTLRSLDLKRAFATNHASAQSGWEAERKTWIAHAGPGKFEERRNHYLNLATAHSELPAQEQAKLKALEQKKRQLQMQKHMESHLIERAKIPKIGAGRKATLASFGFEDAWDVMQRPITNVPGFGPSLAADVMGWARSVERKFVFNNAIPTDPQAIQQIKAEIGKKRAEFERELHRAPDELRRLADDAHKLVKSPPQRLIEAYQRLKQFEVDMGRI
ncbi:helix-hairpin-helix domain-containing protein [Sinorhizobium meliloti]|uniref:helix-hairpin-helix domain-containing protein n=1 Tax=Rhizobium meliloti TaxID=382 RepID=UPI000B4983CF|nr:protein kinase domain-containing protein [Sinorhizobium meliloti]ASQ06004.1 protein kinase domain-containing protein [Sinorhizobium meliloti]MQV33047.1 protein kinase domain-containing protein [Sinorhizobium meliloti]MQV43796.1 protein kinase domain-containing protein [Sinorhizobium meliloti]RVE85685.1 protein kinase domain-containing protein [Sinorhizobium meliloti]RVG49058.1 protein kinase domain-containing protein [Sinorhizobium meliloti]